MGEQEGGLRLAALLGTPAGGVDRQLWGSYCKGYLDCLVMFRLSKLLVFILCIRILVLILFVLKHD